MGQKVNPLGIRTGVIKNWQSRWFDNKKYANQLKEDIEIRDFIMKKLRSAMVSSVIIERSAQLIKIIIRAARPGIVIGRGGSGAEDLKKTIAKKFFMNRKIDIKIEIEEIKNIEEDATVIGLKIAEQLEKRIPYRRAMKAAIDEVMESRKVKGIKVEVAGRLGGTDIARREWLSKGTLPLHTLRADIDFAKVTAKTTYGVIGVKVWIYKKDVFDKQ